MDLSDPMFHTRRIQWRVIEAHGHSVHDVMFEAQKQGLWRLASSAAHRIENQKRKEAVKDA